MGRALPVPKREQSREVLRRHAALWLKRSDVDRRDVELLAPINTADTEQGNLKELSSPRTVSDLLLDIQSKEHGSGLPINFTFAPLSDTSLAHMSDLLESENWSVVSCLAMRRRALLAPPLSEAAHLDILDAFTVPRAVPEANPTFGAETSPFVGLPSGGGGGCAGIQRRLFGSEVWKFLDGPLAPGTTVALCRLVEAEVVEDPVLLAGDNWGLLGASHVAHKYFCTFADIGSLPDCLACDPSNMQVTPLLEHAGSTAITSPGEWVDYSAFLEEHPPGAPVAAKGATRVKGKRQVADDLVSEFPWLKEALEHAAGRDLEENKYEYVMDVEDDGGGRHPKITFLCNSTFLPWRMRCRSWTSARTRPPRRNNLSPICSGSRHSGVADEP